MVQFVHGTCNAEFDEGRLKWDLAAAKSEVEATMAILTDTHPPIRMEDNRVRWIFQLCWIRVQNVFLANSPCFVFDSKS